MVNQMSVLAARHQAGKLLLLAGLIFGLCSVGLAYGSTSAVKARLVERSLLLSGHAVEGLAVVVGERGHILRSEDGGRSWQQAEVPTRATLTAVYLHDKTLGWAVGHDQVILRTRDGARTWQLLEAQPEAESPLLDIWFADAQHGFAVGAYGLFLESADGGDSWSERRIGEGDFHFNQIVHAGVSRLYIVGEAGTLLRSDDGGRQWQALKSPYEGSFFGALALSEDSLLVFGLRGHLFRSDDGGASWVELNSGADASLSDGLLLEDGTIFIAGLAGTMLVSQDQGRSFSYHQQEDRKGFSALVTAVDGMLVGVGEFGVKQFPINSYLTVK